MNTKFLVYYGLALATLLAWQALATLLVRFLHPPTPTDPCDCGALDWEPSSISCHAHVCANCGRMRWEVK